VRIAGTAVGWLLPSSPGRPEARLVPGVPGSGRVPHSPGQVLAGQGVRVWAGGYRCGMNDVEQVPRLRPEVTVTLTFTW